MGFKRWCDLYPPRQLRLLLSIASLASSSKIDETIRNRIQLALANSAEMAGFLCRWDRFHPKAFEAVANHHFSPLGLSVETNLVSSTGRGTFVKRLKASLAAAQWAWESNNGSNHKFVARRDGMKREESAAAVIRLGSSTSQDIPDKSVALIITDPPYYDAIHYGDLSRLFLTWSKVVKGTSPQKWRHKPKLEAIPVPRNGANHYGKVLTEIFRETSRTIAEGGRLLITYHSSDFRGWEALGSALYGAGLRVAALAVAHSENEKDHSKRNRLSFRQDLVIECLKSNKRGKSQSLQIVTVPKTSEQKELLAAGRAIALHAQGGAHSMSAAFLRYRSSLHKKRIGVPQSLLGRLTNGQERAGKPHRNSQRASRSS